MDTQGHTDTHTHTHTQAALPCVFSVVFDSIIHPHVESIIFLMKLKRKKQLRTTQIKHNRYIVRYVHVARKLQTCTYTDEGDK